ncbi:MAG TPA: type II toxin-antitoxin system HicA family toxin [Spirochaetota bacterium]|nr:type II toxin-antitoxin system HicA family toxin [Spirochaetota bacterium]
MTGKEVIDLLQSKGWKLDRIKGSHYIMVKGKKTLSVPVHSKKDLPTGLLNKLLKEGGLK